MCNERAYQIWPDGLSTTNPYLKGITLLEAPHKLINFSTIQEVVYLQASCGHIWPAKRPFKLMRVVKHLPALSSAP